MRISRANAERLGDHMVNLFPSASAPAVQAKPTEEDSAEQEVEEADSSVVMRKCEACEGEKEGESSNLQCKEDKSSNHSAKAEQDVFIRQGAYAPQGEQVQKKPGNSQNQNSKQSSVWEEGGRGIGLIFWWFGTTFVADPGAALIENVLSIGGNRDKAPENPDIVPKGHAYECTPNGFDPKTIETLNNMISLLRRGNARAVSRIIEALSHTPRGKEGLYKLHSLISSMTKCGSFTDDKKVAQLVSEMATLLRMIGPFL